MRWLIFICLLLCSCQARETHLSLQSSDQAQEAAQKKLSQDIAPAIAQLPPDIQAVAKKAVDDALLLLATSRDAIRPALALAQGNEPAPESRTTAEHAYNNPQEFARQSAMQTGRAHAEVENYQGWMRAGSYIAGYGQALATDWLSLLLLGGGGAGLAGGLAAKGIQVYRAVKNRAEELKGAVEDAVAFGDDALKATKPPEIEAVLAKHKERQEKHGTRGIIKQIKAKVS